MLGRHLPRAIQVTPHPVILAYNSSRSGLDAKDITHHGGSPCVSLTFSLSVTC